jgi:hypothetical protein
MGIIRRWVDSLIWLAAWLYTTRASYSHTKETATSYADHCLKEYHKRFRN